MALIGQIRKHSGLLIVIIGIALAAFVLGDFLKPSNKYRINYIGEIAGEEIPIQDFNQKVEEQVQIRKEQQQSDAKLTAQDIYNIKQGVWNQAVQEIVLGKEYDELGLTVTSDELSDQILSENPHRFVQQSFKDPNTGTFDPEMVKTFLQNLDNQSADMKRRYLNLEKMIKDDRLNTKYKNLLIKGYHVPEAFARFDYNNKNSKVTFRYVAPKFSTVADSLVDVTDEDLRSYYDEFKYNYQQDRNASVDYVIFEIKASDDDRKALAQEINRLYNEFKTTEDVATFVNSVSDDRYDSSYKKETDLSARIAREMMESPIGTLVGPYIENEIYHIARLMDRQPRPDSIKMSQILISYSTAPSGMNISERTLEDAESLADSLLTVLKRNPSKYEDLAVAFSDYPTAAEDKGDMSWITDGDPGYATFYTEALKVKKGGIEKMESPLGLHIIQVTDETKPIDKVRVAMITRAIEPSNETYQDVYLAASEFSGENRTLVQFDTAVVNQGLNKRVADRLSPMANRIAGVENPRQIIRWAFFENVNESDVSPVFEDGTSFIVAVLKHVSEKGPTPFEQVKEQIRPLVVNRKKGDIIVDRINSLNATDLAAIAAEFGEKVDTAANLSFSARNIPGFGREYEVIGEAFTLEPGQLSKPLKGNNAVFVMILDDMSIPEDKEATTLVNANQLSSAFTSQVNSNSMFKALEKKADITDNRMMFY
nr:SurA N-terminal domain-containing protein [Bacteroidota bacterium]